MTLGILFALPAIALIAMATPRQAEWLFGATIARRRLSRWRAAGWALLAISLIPILTGGDAARAFIGWTCATGVIALAAALALTLKMPRRR